MEHLNTKHLFLAYNIDPLSGGIEKYLYELTQSYNQLSIPNHVYQFGHQNSKMYLFYLLSKAIFKSNAKYIHCTHIHLLTLCIPLCFLLRKKIILYAYGIEIWGAHQQKYTKFAPFIHQVISISTFTTQNIYFVPKSKIYYLPPFISIPIMPAIINNSIPKSKIILLTVGRMSSLEQYKGHDFTLQALSYLKEKRKLIQYRVIGAGDDRPRLQNIAKNLGLIENDDYIFLGKLSATDLEQEYKNSDIFIMPSRVHVAKKIREQNQGEGFGIVFLEASAYGLPLIGPFVGGSMDIIQDNINGLLVDPCSPQDIAEKILDLTLNSEKRNRLGMQARILLEKNFGPEQNQQRIIDILHSFINNPPYYGKS